MLPLFHVMTREEERIVKGALAELGRQATPSHK
jgi:hypothetical protein